MAVLARNRMQDDTNAGVNAVNEYYDDAANYEQPYTEHANEDFNAGRNALYKGARMQGQNPHYNQIEYHDILSKTPDQLLGQALSGYKMSTYAQNMMKVMMSALNNTMIASGEQGSGRHMAAAANLGASILSKDMGQYLGLEDKAFKTQQGVLSQYDKENQEIIKLFQNMVGTENKASKDMADNAMRAGQQTSNLYGRESNQERFFDPINELADMMPTNDHLERMLMSIVSPGSKSMNLLSILDS